ncbi:hypothetical protein O6H91_09G006300 [Diphasiastrum complanatum]|uniref:Uncharacterized protein n=1 Tax=Diphasiastrum complanatum TaxID=34168 RepID=A0ACC2CL13_DIPCM|nr:hypothetical protein O6H91_09G006300 [Diphasiastrum complanatum]
MYAELGVFSASLKGDAVSLGIWFHFKCFLKVTKVGDTCNYYRRKEKHMVCMDTISSQGWLMMACPCNFPIQVLNAASCCSSTFVRTNALAYCCSSRLSQEIKIERKVANKFSEALDIWIPQNDQLIRNVPLFLGGSSIIAVLLNRTVSGISFVADASSSYSRADLLSLALAVSVLLTGLIWKSIEPKEPSIDDLQGVHCFWLNSELPTHLQSEVEWAWEALSKGSRSRALVVVYHGMCILQAGIAAESSDFKGQAVKVDVIKLLKGSLSENVRASGKQSYLANLSLYPGRFELSFLPGNTQAVILQPLGDEGIMVVGSDQIRGFGPRDQAWITTIGEKLDASISKWIIPHSPR